MKYVQEPGQFFRYPRYVQVGQLCFLGGGGWGFTVKVHFYNMNTYNCTIVRTGYRLLSIEGWTLILTYLGQASSIQVTLAVHWCWNAIWNTGWSVRLFAYSNFSTIDVHPKKIFINRGPLQMSWPWNPVAPWSMKERKRKNDILKNLAFWDIFARQISFLPGITPQWTCVRARRMEIRRQSGKWEYSSHIFPKNWI